MYYKGYRERRNKKKSGCKSTVISKGNNKGNICITGWNVSKKRGFIRMAAFPKKDAKINKSKNGRRWMSYLVEIVFTDKMDKKLFNGLYDLDNNKLIIPDLQMVANPKAPRGGYFGTWRS